MSDIETTSPTVDVVTTPHVQLVWGIRYNSTEVNLTKFREGISTTEMNINEGITVHDSDGDSTLRIKVFESFDSVARDAEAHGMSSPLLGPETDDFRDFCEPECVELPKGSHHPNCSQLFLLDASTAAFLPLH